MKKIIYAPHIIVLLCFLFISSSGFAQDSYGTLKGKVSDTDGNTLEFANVFIKETNIGTATGKKGKYVLPVKAGTYTVTVSFIGYKKVTETVVILSGKTTELDFTLQSESFEIGGIEVVADNEFIPLDAETKTRVTSGEIEHMQASSLNDVLELTPGVETSNPTLNSVEQASIRGGDPLGTQIIMDGVPISNNANMQVGIGYSTANSGVDLRSIPAENIAEVEVIRGIPSAEYGDLVDGIMIVKTKAVAQRPILKFKYNPKVYEMNINGGYKFGDWVVNGNFNLASSERDFRVEGDGYTRLAAQITVENDSETDQFKNVVYFTRSFDERSEQPGYALREAWSNKDINIKYTANYTKYFSSFERFEAKFSASYTNQDSYEQQLVSRDNIVVSDRIVEGTQEGHIVFGTYLGKKWIKGEVWNLFADVNYKFKFFTDDLLHSWVAGATWRDDFNVGEGIVFDPLFPPALTIPSPRIRTYDDLPHYQILSLYLEDKITGRLLRPFTLQFGARYEVYRPESFDISGLWGQGDLIGGKNGSFFNPRLNFSMKIFDDTQIRLSYGMTTKSPPLGMIAAQDKYYDLVDTVSVVNPENPEENFSLISTHIRQQANPNLKAYSQRKYEGSIDQQFGPMGFSITGYINNTEDMFRSLSEPTIFYKQSFPDYPDVSTAFAKDTLLDTYSRYLNDGWLKVRGIEFTFKTRRIPVINTAFRFDAAYSYTESGTYNGYYFGSKRFVNALGLEVQPIYNAIEYYSKDLLLNYRFEVQVEKLGMWLTLHVQQKLFEIDGRRNYADTLAIGYFSQLNEMVMIPEGNRANPLYEQIRRSVESYELNEEDKPNKWLFNLKVSKSLWDGAAISFFVNNFFNDRPLYQYQRRSPTSPQYTRRNPGIFYGLEFHTKLSGVF